MASLEQIEKQVRGLSGEELGQLQQDLKGIKKEIAEREGMEKAGRWKKEVGIDDRVDFRRGNKAQSGTVDAVLRDGVRVRTEGGKRARTVKWHEITSKR
jgi:hypothetical protein